jgi:hypothetical protein
MRSGGGKSRSILDDAFSGRAFIFKHRSARGEEIGIARRRAWYKEAALLLDLTRVYLS